MAVTKQTAQNFKLDLSMLNVDGKAHGVRKHNFNDLFRTFSHVRQKKHARHQFGVLVNPVDTPDLWGPWVVYLLAKGIYGKAMINGIHAEAHRTHSRDRRVNSVRCNLCVPAPLPSDFDADETDLEMEKRIGDDSVNREARIRDRETVAATDEDRARVQEAVKKIRRNMDVFDRRNNLANLPKRDIVAPADTQIEEEKLPWD